MAATGFTKGDPQKVARAGDTMTGRLIMTADNVDVDVQQAISTAVSTGVLSGGEITVNGSNPQAIDISALVGYVVDATTVPTSPSVVRVSTNNMTVALTGASLTRVITWWIMDSAGVVTQQATRPTNIQRRTHLVLGVTAYNPTLATIFVDQTLPVINSQPANQLADLMDALGPFAITGCVPTPNGANLSINVSAGDVFARAFNHFTASAQTKNPHVTSTPTKTLTNLRRLTQVAQFPAPPQVTTIDPTQWDNGGVLTPVAGNDATIQRVWLFPANDPNDQVVVQYGQTLYATFTDAKEALGQGDYVRNPTVLDNAALIGYIIVLGTATALNNPAHASFITASKFDRP